MTYTLAYLDTAIAMNHLLDGILKYERERLMTIQEGTMRKQVYVREERWGLGDLGLEVSATYETLTMHLEAYRGDVADNTFLEYTPIGQQIAMGSIEMLRAVAQSEMDYAWADSFADDLSGEEAGDLRILSSQMQAQDTYLFGRALDINEAYMGVYVPVLS